MKMISSELRVYELTKIKVIGINGPPRVGKDTLSNAIYAEVKGYEGIRATVVEMKEAVFQVLNLWKILDEDNSVGYEELKEKYPQVRQILIAFMQKVIKPIMGDDYFVKYAFKPFVGEQKRPYHLDLDTIIIVPDLGFTVEYDYLKEIFNDDFISVQLRKDGVDFSNDSRNYVNADITFENLTVDDYTNAAKSILKHIGVKNV